MDRWSDKHWLTSHERRARIADFVVAALFMGIGVYIAYASLTDYQAFGGRVGPGVLPFMIGITLVLTSALIMLRLRRDVAVEDADMPDLIEASRAGSLLALTIVTVLLIPILGAIVTLGLFGLIETTILEKRGWKLGLLTAVTIPLLLYTFFDALLGVPLPSGRLGLL